MGRIIQARIDGYVVTASAEKAKEILGWEAKYSDVNTLISTTWEAYQKYHQK